MALKVQIKGYVMTSDGKEELKPYNWDFDYFKAWLTDILDPRNRTIKVVLEIELVKVKNLGH